MVQAENQDGYLETMETNYNQTEESGRARSQKSKAWEWANTRKGYWHIANSHILKTTITTDRLKQAGYVFLRDYYQKVRIKT